MKRIMSIGLMSILSILMLVGCSKDKVVQVGIVQMVEHPSLDTIRETVTKTLEEEGYVDGENIKIEYKNAQNDASNLNAICQKFVGDQVDVIVAIATQSAQIAAAATDEIPIIFSAVTDPVGAGIIENMKEPEGNVTGTSAAIPLDQVFELVKTLTPEVKTFGFLYTASESNSRSVIEEAKKVAPDFGYDYEEVTITNTSELSQAASALANRVDAIYTPTDNSIASAMPILAEVGKSFGIPVYVGADSMVMDGGYATVGINYERLGIKTAQMVKEVLNGAPIKNIPVETLDNFDKVINQTTAKVIGATDQLEGAIVVK